MRAATLTATATKQISGSGTLRVLIQAAATKALHKPRPPVEESVAMRRVTAATPTTGRHDPAPRSPHSHPLPRRGGDQIARDSARAT